MDLSPSQVVDVYIRPGNWQLSKEISMDSTLLTTGRLVGPVKRGFNSKISMDSTSSASQPKKRGRPKGSKTKEDRESGTKGVAVTMRGGDAGDKKVAGINFCRYQSPWPSLSCRVYKFSFLKEIPYENHVVRDTRKVDYGTVSYMEKLNLLQNNLLAAHTVWVNEKEIQLLSEAGVKVSHCPASAMRMLGFAPIKEMLDANICVSLGTDVAPSNNRMSICSFDLLFPSFKLCKTSLKVIRAMKGKRRKQWRIGIKRLWRRLLSSKVDLITEFFHFYPLFFFFWYIYHLLWLRELELIKLIDT